MRRRMRGYRAVAGLAVLALAVAACSGSTAKTSPGPSPTIAGFQGLNPGSGTPREGGTLYMLGQGDVDVMDYNLSYYAIGYLGQRPWVRGLYAYPAIPGKTTDAAPDLASGPPMVSNGGKTYSVTLRSGGMWNTSPPRPVTAADALLGLKRSCNRVQPFGGLSDFEALIVGYLAFCTGFNTVAPTAAGIRSYIDSHQISGVRVVGQTISYTLVHPASYFPGMLTMDAFNPAPVESLNYLPGSAAAAQHTIADGPYQVQSYTPARSIVYVRNPVWRASSDPIRKAYVSKIVVSETGSEPGVQQQLETGSGTASMEFDAFPPQAALPGLVSGMNKGLNHDFNLGPTYTSIPYLVYNEVSPSNGGALSKVAVRQALSYGTDRAHLISDDGGPVVSPPLTQILPPGINGFQDLPPGYHPYPYNVAKAKSMLAAAGYQAGLTLTVLYRSDSAVDTAMAQTLRADLARINVKIKLLGVTTADFYTKYVELASAAKRGAWDIAIVGWGPDWYGDAAVSFFAPLYSGPSSYPPAGSDFGLFSDPAVTSLITRGAAAATASAAAALWAQADEAVMKDAAVYPITDPQQADYHASYLHNAVYVPVFEQFDPTNVWLSSR
jgi:peptide/nickel transport system substrate-binding protein